MMSHRPAVFVVILICLLGVQVSAENLLTNPGFESFPVGISYGDGVYSLYDWRWFSVSGAGGTIQSFTPGQQGNVAIRLSRSSEYGDSGLDRASNMVSASAGRRYRATVWARSSQNSMMLLKIAAHDSAGNFLNKEVSAYHCLSADYRQYTVEFTAPAQTGQLNFAIRLYRPGALDVDNCALYDISDVPPDVPTITYPSNETVDSLKPTVAFSGSPHDACQAVITQGENTVWDSGIVNSTAFTRTCPIFLQPLSTYQVRVRLQNSVGWSDYSAPSQFSTPSAPVVRFTTPLEAEVIRGPSYTVRWTAESPTGITSQWISIDGGSWVSLLASRRYRSFSGLTEGLHTVTLLCSSNEGTVMPSTTFYVRNTPAESGTIYYYDMTYTWNYSRSVLSEARTMYDIHLAVVALQGLVNRNGPRLFIRYWGSDPTWWTRMTQSGNWLANKTVVNLPTGIDNLPALFNTFRDELQGAVLWDQNVHATSNVAVTVAGADSLIPIRYDPTPGSVYDRLVVNGPQLPVSVDLTNKFTGSGLIWDTSIPSTGSKKNDAYIWARTKYLETGKSNPSLLNYAVDAYWETNTVGASPGHALLSRDYIIRNKGFCYDLSVWPDEKPIDDPNQTMGLDFSTYRSILSAASARVPGMIHIIHCIPWPYKYTNWPGAGGTRHPVSTEWESTGWLSRYNAYADADSYAYVDMTNASLYCQFPLPDRLTQNRKLSHTELRKLGYIDTQNRIAPLNFLHPYIGDYDSAMWLTNVGVSKWDDGYRGVHPLSWAFNPNLVERAAAIYEYYNRTRTAKDSFIAGDSGAGYVNPTLLIANRQSGLPSAKDIWIEHNLKYFRKTNTKISGFLLNGFAGRITPETDEMYEKFSVDGTLTQPPWYPQGDHMSGSMPAMVHLFDLPENDAIAAAGMVQPMGLQGLTQFLSFRTIIVTPTYINNFYNSVVSRDTSIPWALVDAPTYLSLGKMHMGMVPDNRATYTFDTIPSQMTIGQSANALIGIVNDGWIDWQPSGAQAVNLVVTWKQGSQIVKTASLALPRSVPSADGIILNANLSPPAAPGTYTLIYEMAKGGIPFSMLGDYSWEKTVTVNLPAVEGTTSQVKSYADGTVVFLPSAVVSAGTDQFADCFYVQDADRTGGIKVKIEGGINASEGEEISVAGTLATEHRERTLIEPMILSQVPGDSPIPLSMIGRSIGGGSLNPQTPGIPGASGLLNTGLLVSIWGRVTHVGDGFFYIDDGSGLDDGSGFIGVRVDCEHLAVGNLIVPPLQDQYVAVHGISSISSLNGSLVPTVRPRKQADLLISTTP